MLVETGLVIFHSEHDMSGTWKMTIRTVSNSISGILHLFCGWINEHYRAWYKGDPEKER